MNALERFKQSPAWDDRYGLPLVPQHNNPFIYCAYSYQLMHLHDPDSPTRIDQKFKSYVEYCEIEKGLYYRWPDKSGGPFSWDEIVGVGFISSVFAKDMYHYIKKHWGCYDNGTDPDKRWRFFRYNQYRMPFLMPYLKICMGEKLNWADKIIIKGFLKADACNYKQGDEGGRIRIWLMNYKFIKEIPEEVSLWSKAMDNTGITPKNCFSIYFPNHKIFTDFAPASFASDFVPLFRH